MLPAPGHPSRERKTNRPGVTEAPIDSKAVWPGHQRRASAAGKPSPWTANDPCSRQPRKQVRQGEKKGGLFGTKRRLQDLFLRCRAKTETRLGSRLRLLV